MDALLAHLMLKVEDLDWKDAPDGVRYVPLSTQPGDAARPLTILSELPPGHVEPPHTHGCDYIEIILRGTIRIGKIDMAMGDIRMARAGKGYGPLVSGEKGCTRLTIFDRADGSPMRLMGRAAIAAVAG